MTRGVFQLSLALIGNGRVGSVELGFLDISRLAPVVPRYILRIVPKDLERALLLVVERRFGLRNGEFWRFLVHFEP